MVVGIAGQWGTAGARGTPLVLLAIASVALFLSARWLARRGVLDAPVLRQRGVNLEATREGPEPMIWLCAHLDSKSQPIPTLVRSAGFVLESIGFLLTFALAFLAALGVAANEFYWVVAAAVTLLGAIPVMLSVVGSRSPGALDNASGVATVLAAARELGQRPGFGILITDAEELGLAGARAWSRNEIPVTVLNCDGVDDDGGIEVMYTGEPPTALLDAVSRASDVTGVRHHADRLFPGILTDSVAFSDEGMRSVTFSRGTLRSLARVHSRRDDLAHLHGTGIAETAKLIAATARQLGDLR